MPALPQPGAFTATGLPQEDFELFRAWLFLCGNLDLMPAAYRNDFTTNVARRLTQSGERRTPVTAGALLCVMPPEARGLIARNISPDVAQVVAEFARHTVTSFAYIEQASPAVQKIILSFNMGTIEWLGKQADEQLKALHSASSDNGGAKGQPSLQLLPDARRFLLLADKTQGTTGNTRLENTFVDAALEYKAERQAHFQQLLSVDGLPGSVRARLAAELQDTPLPPRLHETALPATDELLAIYGQVCMDPRVDFNRLVDAISVAEIIADAGETAPALLGAALLSTALPHISPTDETFLERIGAGPAVDILRDNRETEKMNAPLIYAPVAGRQITLARTILAIRQSHMLVERVEERLATSLAKAEVNLRQQYVTRAFAPITALVRDVHKDIVPQLPQLECDALATELQSQLRLLNHSIGRVNGSVMPGYLSPQHQRPATGGPKAF